jgi:hemoglobin-like flavoprotein
MKRFTAHLCFAVVLFTALLQAQTTKEKFLSNRLYAGGLYCPYPYNHPVSTPAPNGYVPFYISHYGRHGSRWVLSSTCHEVPKNILGDAEKVGALTVLGKSLYERIKIAADDAADRYGDLSPLGTKEQKAIAERMFRSFPDVFSAKNGRRCIIHSRSTQVPRCILSMAANSERLKELNPEMDISRDATKRDKYLNNDPGINNDTVKAIVAAFLERHFSPRRFIASIFSDTVYAKEHIKDQTNFANLVFSAAVNMPNLDYLNISMLDVFTPDETFILWQALNLQMYSQVGPSAVNGKSALRSASLLLKDIVQCADFAINNQNVSADLRFGHDSYIIPLLALMDIQGMNVQEPDPDKVYTAWCNYEASPMGTNLQLIFYKNDKNDDILVKLLHCEKETVIPVTTDAAPYYHWKDVRTYYEKKILE